MDKGTLLLVVIILIFSLLLTATRSLVLSKKSVAFDAVTIWQYEKGAVLGWVAIGVMGLIAITIKQGFWATLPLVVAWAFGLFLILVVPERLLKRRQAEQKNQN